MYNLAQWPPLLLYHLSEITNFILETLAKQYGQH